MEYMLIFTETAEDFAVRNDPAKAPGYWAGWMAYIGALRATGHFKSGNGLQPPETATTVRLRNGKRLVQDGPFADSKEQLAGYVVMDLPTLDDALEWAARSPSATSGCTEVRPVLPAPSMPDQ